MAREFQGQQFTDSWGDVWTVGTCPLTPGDVSIRVDTTEGPLTVTIPAEDVDQLSSRLAAAAMVARRKAVERAAVKPACDGTCGDCSDTGEFPGAAHVGEVS
jgi:hypothetical protein